MLSTKSPLNGKYIVSLLYANQEIEPWSTIIGQSLCLVLHLKSWNASYTNKCYRFIETKLSAAQFGFRVNHSTVQQLLMFYSQVYDQEGACNLADVIFLDFAKAFDTLACYIARVIQKGGLLPVSYVYVGLVNFITSLYI